MSCRLLFIVFALILSETTWAAAPTCKGLFGLTEAEISEAAEKPKSKASSRSLNISMAERLSTVLNGLSPELRGQLFEELKGLTRLQAISIMEKKDMPPRIAQMLKENPELEQIFVDFVAFTEVFPGIMQVPNAEAWTLKVLRSIMAQEKAPQHSSEKILESQGSAPRLSRSINGTIANLIQQATVDYLGMRFTNNMGPKYVWYRVKRFFLPLYTQVRRQVEAGQFYQRQLERLRVVDALVIREVLTDTHSKTLSEQDIEAATNLVLDSPTEIASIEKSLKQVYGSRFSDTSTVEIGTFDIYKGSRNLNEKDLSEVQDSFEKNNVDSMDKMNELIDLQRKNVNQPPRKLSEKHLDELRIYHEAQNRRLWRWKEQYEGWTAQDTKESYTVEDQHTRQVPDGKDKDGKTTYKTETYYTDRSVTPSFEDLLTGQFDRGDRSVSGLDNIIDRASQMTARERPTRNILGNVEQLFENILEHYTEMISQGKGREGFKNDMEEFKKVIAEEIERQRSYASMTASQIRSQYGKDDVENFQRRNEWILLRLENAERELIILGELMRRNELQLILSFDIMDFEPWMRDIRIRRNWNYAIKTIITVPPIGGGIAYGFSPEFAMWVNTHGQHIVQFFQNLAQ